MNFKNFIKSFKSFRHKLSYLTYGSIVKEIKALTKIENCIDSCTTLEQLDSCFFLLKNFNILFEDPTIYGRLLTYLKTKRLKFLKSNVKALQTHKK